MRASDQEHTSEKIDHIHDVALAYTLEECKTDPRILWTVTNFYDRYEENCHELITHTEK